MNRGAVYLLLIFLGLGFILLFPPYLEPNCCRNLALSPVHHLLRFPLGICRHIYWGVWGLCIVCWLFTAGMLYFHPPLKERWLVLIFGGLSGLALVFTFAFQPHFQMVNPYRAVFLVWLACGLSYLMIARSQMNYNPAWGIKKKQLRRQLLKAGFLLLVILTEALLILGWLFYLNCRLPKG